MFSSFNDDQLQQIKDDLELLIFLMWQNIDDEKGEMFDFEEDDENVNRT
jgi:hypothetical protein